MYSLNYKVTTSTCDSEGKLKLFSALQMMQDCSEMWIDSEPQVQVKEYFARENMAQLLASRQVEIMRVPGFKEELTVTPSACGQTGPTHWITIFSFEKLILLHVEIKSLCSFPDQIQMLPLSGHT